MGRMKGTGLRSGLRRQSDRDKRESTVMSEAQADGRPGACYRQATDVP